MGMSNKYLAVLGILLLGTQCYRQPENSGTLSPKAQTLLAEKIAARKADLQRECVNLAIEAAQIKVDSILWLRTYQEKLEFFHVPQRPDKPNQPVIPKIEDTTPVKPLWADTLQ